MAPGVNIELVHGAVKDENVKVLKRDLGLSDQEIHDMTKIVANDNQWSDCLFNLGRCLAALGVALSGIGGIMSADGDFGAAIIFFVFAILYSLTGLGLMRYWKENRGSVERKLHRRFPQLRFSKMLPANGGGWQVEKRTAEVPGQFVGTLEFV